MIVILKIKSLNVGRLFLIFKNLKIKKKFCFNNVICLLFVSVILKTPLSENYSVTFLHRNFISVLDKVKTTIDFIEKIVI